ncbi:MAG: hypothetical protein Q7R96_03835 [Nanoarchaeota archaeon]|nr:hypothetical protein [Nanoarchaeota archaeon]
MKHIILIGGAPTTGKSTLAAHLSKKLNLPWLSTDQLRQVMRTVADKKKYKKLFNPKGYNAERFLTTFPTRTIVKMEIEQGEATWKGIKELLDKDFTYEEGFILEGVNILPKLAASYKSKKHIKIIFLINDNKEHITKTVFTRGLWDDTKNYPDHVKHHEVAWVTAFNDYIKHEAKKYCFPTLNIHADHAQKKLRHLFKLKQP